MAQHLHPDAASGGQQHYAQMHDKPLVDLSVQLQQTQIAPHYACDPAEWQHMPVAPSSLAYPHEPSQQDIDTLKRRLGDNERVRKMLASPMKVRSSRGRWNYPLTNR